MKFIRLIIGLLLFSILGCQSPDSKIESTQNPTSDVKIVGAMKNVMWKGELAAVIHLDTIKNKIGLYGLGPIDYLRGELMIVDGKSYVSRVLSDSTMKLEETFDVQAPFFVYANNSNWTEEILGDDINGIKDLENYISEATKNKNRPFVFKLTGRIDEATIHIQNLAEGSTVSSPEEAHRGQVNYHLGKSEVEIVGFFSTAHQGIFTHHDSYLHMHLITSDKMQMGHLDEVLFTKGEMKLFLPE